MSISNRVSRTGFEWVNEVCPRCDKPVYQGDWSVRCRCNGSMLRAEIEALQSVLDEVHESWPTFIEDCAMHSRDEAAARRAITATRERHAEPPDSGRTTSARCASCGFTQDELNWCQRCGHRTVWAVDSGSNPSGGPR